MLHLAASTSYYLYRGATDMRKGFDSLSGIVLSEMHLDPLNGAIFIFFNRKRNQVKLLLFEGDGFALYHKRLEKGTYELPSVVDPSGTTGISSQQLQFILQGVILQKIHFHPRFKKQHQLSTAHL
jgi:transposase